MSVWVLACSPVLAEMIPGDAHKAPLVAAPEEWQKIETRPLNLPDPRQVLSPGLYDADLQHVVVFPKDGSAVDLGLPHFGKDAAGKSYPPVTARINQEHIWVDANGDGKPGAGEYSAFKDGWTSTFVCDLHYEDGTVSPYAFRLKSLAEKAKFALIRCTARAASFQGQRLVLLDDNGNGLYGDLEKDAVLAGDGPVSLLGKYIQIAGKSYELLVHAAGGILEIRPVQIADAGAVDMFKNYEPSQESETTRIHTIIITGAGGSYAFDAAHRVSVVPAGYYDLAFVLIERAKEFVYAKKGAKTSFSVAPKEIAAPKWGGAISMAYNLTADGQEVTISPPEFAGAASERYFPENFRVIPVYAHIAQVFTDNIRMEHFQIFGGQKRFEVQPDGSLKAVVYKPFRSANDLYEATVEYNSGIMGKVTGRQRLQFYFKRK